MVFVDAVLGSTLCCAGALVVDRAEHAVGGMPSVGVVFVDPGGDGVACCSRVRECRRLSSSNSRVELNDSLAALSRADPVRESTERDRDVANWRDALEEYATVLQHTLLPPTLPHIPALAAAAHDHPASASQVGGDFYEVFALGAADGPSSCATVEGPRPGCCGGDLAGPAALTRSARCGRRWHGR